MSGNDGNVAFKCTYNDGGKRGFVGFNGTCSVGNIYRNVKVVKRRWCSSEQCRCRKFCDDGFRGRTPTSPCYESEIFGRWRFGPGVHRPGTPDSQPIPIASVKEGKVALLTTRHPRCDKEQRRIVFGVYKIEHVVRDESGEIWIEGSADGAIRLSESTAFAVPFWNFKELPPNGRPDWRTGLFRCLSDQEVANFLHALNSRLRSPRDRTVLEELLACCGNLDPEIEGSGGNSDVSESDLEEKYGPEGEGERHRSLKEHIARYPEVLGLGRGTSKVEHLFVTRDRVDVSVALDSGEHCVVEVEVEGESTRIGAHQALKYRALLAGQLDLREPPHAYLVAYSIPQSVKDFCQRHGVFTLEVQP